jgi:hypothetical protein
MKTLRLALLVTSLLVASQISAQRSSSPIRSIDFANLTYPGRKYGVYKTPFPERRFRLRKGKYGDWRYGMTLMKTSYGDVTGDGKEEAILVFSHDSEGNGIYNSVYLYTLESNRPKLLWAFMTGDRADGGLRRVYARGGKLTVELFGRESRVEGDSASSSVEPTALCCPNSFTRTQYVWRNGRFEQKGEMDIQPYSAANPVRQPRKKNQ